MGKAPVRVHDSRAVSSVLLFAPDPPKTSQKIFLVALLGLHFFLLFQTLRLNEGFDKNLVSYDMSRPKGSDFFSMYHAGINVKREVSPYNNEPDGYTPFFYPFRYLPGVAYAAVPLTLLPPHTAYYFWIGILEVVLLFFVYLIWHRQSSSTLRLISCSALLLSSPFFLEVYMGQFTFISVTLFMIVFFVDRFYSKTIALFTSFFMKPFTVVALPVLLTEKETRWVVVPALLSVFISVPYFMFHPYDWELFRLLNGEASPAVGLGSFGSSELFYLLLNQWKAYSSILNLHLWMRWLYLILLAVNVVAVVLSRAHPIAKSSLLLLGHFLAYPHVWEHHYSAVVVLATALLTLIGERKWFYILVSICLAIIALPTPFLYFYKNLPLVLSDPFLAWPYFPLYIIVLSKWFPAVLLYLCALQSICQQNIFWLKGPRHSSVESLARY